MPAAPLIAVACLLAGSCYTTQASPHRTGPAPGRSNGVRHLGRVQWIIAVGTSVPSSITFTRQLKPRAGKSTLSKGIISSLHNFTLLSINALIYGKHGLYAIDYTADNYTQHQDERHRLGPLVLEQKVSLRVQGNGGAERRAVGARVPGCGKARFAVADCGTEGTRDALGESDEGQDGDSAFDVDDEAFERFCGVFERPVGEGEVVVKVA
ncbi:Uncharacterized protein TCAP_03315 [Tolypocladium capitatum]|uniref:Uncharacterized protein n=1 Tax=Tolypocladium capitatum TaxID=45235 RepID=A0A2K3QGR6_9HYPO|nr:Uncharacterized protein TCAP_03315 [Tolypocladium capitatum]